MVRNTSSTINNKQNTPIIQIIPSTLQITQIPPSIIQVTLPKIQITSSTPLIIRQQCNLIFIHLHDLLTDIIGIT